MRATEKDYTAGVKLVTFETKTPAGPVERLGALLEGRIVDLNAAQARMLAHGGRGGDKNPALPPAIIPFLELGAKGLDEARHVLEFARDALFKAETRKTLNDRPVYRESEIRLLSPVPRPGAIRDFFAFEDHALQGAARRGEAIPPQWYDQPVYYKGNHREIYGPGETVPWPSYTRKLDFEAEIACVVGRKGRDLTPEQAAGHIAGYTIFNDFSARDIQKNEMACRMGPAKGKDFANGLGPYLLTADELAEPENLEMSVWVNGEKWSSGNSGGRYWSFPVMLSHVSQGEIVYPGDVLGSGTYYKGCGLDLDRWIKPGDTVEIEVEKLGRLRQTIGAPKAQTHLKYTKAQANPHAAHR